MREREAFHAWSQLCLPHGLAYALPSGCVSAVEDAELTSAVKCLYRKKIELDVNFGGGERIIELYYFYAWNSRG